MTQDQLGRDGPVPLKVHPIYIVDDDAAIRAELAEWLTARGYTVTTFEDGAAITTAAALLPPGCILLDLQMPGMDGLAVQRELAHCDVCHQIVVVTGHGGIRHAVTVMQGGAVDFIEKPFIGTAILDAIASACERIDTALVRRDRREAALAKLALLTRRETEVMDGLVTGLPNKLIAYRLGLSIRTVEDYRASLMVKLGTRNVADIVRVAHEAEVVPGSG